MMTAAAAGSVAITSNAETHEAPDGGTVVCNPKVVNNYDAPITNVTVVYVNTGATVFTAASIDAGSSSSAPITCTIVFPSSDNKVALNFTVTYLDPDGVSQTASTATQINKSTVIKVTGSASVDDSTLNQGDRATFTFSFKNEGNVTIENATLKAPPIDGGDVIGQAFSLSPGDSKKMTYTISVNSSIDVKPTLTFTAAGTNKSLTLDTIPVTVEKTSAPAISLTLKADKETLSPGEDAVLTATVTNTGTETLTDIALTDGNGGSIQTDFSALGTGESGTATVTVSPQETQKYKFSVTAKDPDGKEVSSTSNQVTIEVAEAQPSESQEPGNATFVITVDADAYTLKEPGEVTFHVTITNNSDVVLNNVQVLEDTIGEIGTVSSMGKDSKTFDKSVQVEKTTDFIFKVTASQEDGTPVTAVTKPLTISIEGTSGVGLGFLGILLIIIVAAIAAVGIALFLMHRKNKKTGGGSGGGVFGKKNGGKAPYGNRRKPSAFNNTITKTNGKDAQPVRTVRKTAPALKPQSPKGSTKFGDRNKF